jgi:hypothetical protein
LVNVNALLNSELRHKNVEGGIQNPNYLGLANDRTVSLGEIRDQHTQEQVSGLLLRENS